MKSRPGRRIAAACTAVLLGLSLASCSSSSTESEASDPVADAPEDALVVYSGRSEELVGGLLADFTEKTGIEVVTRYGETAELAAQLLEEGDRSPADVFLSQDAGALQALEDAGLVVPLPKSVLNKVHKQFRSETGGWVGTSGRARVLLYNKELVPKPELPTSVFDLTDSKWRGQVGIAPTNASFQSFITAMRVTYGEERTREWLDAMVANDVQRYENNVAIRDAVDAGQISLGLANHYYWYEKAAEVGAENLKVQNAFLAPGDPGSLVNVAGVAVLKTGADDPHSEEFVGFQLSPEAQKYYADVTAEYPLIAGVAAAEGLPPLESIQGPDLKLGQLSDLPGTQQMLTEVGLL